MGVAWSLGSLARQTSEDACCSVVHFMEPQKLSLQCLPLPIEAARFEKDSGREDVKRNGGGRLPQEATAIRVGHSSAGLATSSPAMASNQPAPLAPGLTELGVWFLKQSEEVSYSGETCKRSFCWVKTQETPGEHQNRWRMDVHPPKNGAIGYATHGHLGLSPRSHKMGLFPRK